MKSASHRAFSAPVGSPQSGAGRQMRAAVSQRISGENEAILIDALMTNGQADALAEWAKGFGKRITGVYITHGHSDHWLGLARLLEHFPEARGYATPEVAARAEDNLDEIFVIADGISLTCAHPATTSDGIAYSGGADGVTELRATRLSDGQRIWQVTGPGMSLASQPVLARGYACLGFRHESVRVVSIKTGETRWDLPMTVIVGPVVSDSMVFAVGADAAGPDNNVDDVSPKGYVYGVRL